MRKPIIILGYPKSGCTWTSRLVGDALNSPVISNTQGYQKPSLADEGHGRPGKFEVKLWHNLNHGAPEGAKIIYLHRDPRDVALSVRDYWKRGSLDNVFHEKEKPPNPAVGWSRHLDNYFERGHVDVSYTDLRENTFGTLDEIFTMLEIEVVDADIEGAVERQSLANRKKMLNNNLPYGATIQGNLIAKGGRVGTWRNEWKRRHGEAVYKAWNDWMRLLGYESDENWWKMLPE
jgi:hypothetical protein